jgi:hypothetical protein
MRGLKIAALCTAVIACTTVLAAEHAFPPKPVRILVGATSKRSRPW